MAVPRLLKWTLGGLATLVVLLVLAALLLPSLYDPKPIGPLVAGQVKKLTGRDLSLGRISLKILPVPALSVAPVTLSEGPRYPGRDALRIESASIRLRLLGLLKGRLELGTIVIDRPTLTLIRDRQGRWNYDDLLERAAALRSAAKQPAAPASQGGGPRLAVERAVLRGGRVLIYDDAVVPGSRMEARLDPVDASLRDLGTGAVTRMDLSVGLGKSALAAAASLGGQGGGERLDMTVRSSRLQISDLATLLPWLGVARPDGLTLGGGITIDGKADIPLDRPEAISFEGSLDLDDLSYRDATMAKPIERIGGRLRVRGQKADWDGFTARVGTSELRGNLVVEDFQRPRIGFKLDSPRLDVSELIRTFAAAPPNRAGSAAPPRAGEPGAGLVQVSANGTLSVGALRFETFDLSDVRATLMLRSAVLSMSKFQAKLYGGRLGGSCTLDLSRPTPGYGLDASLDTVDVNALAAAYDPGLKDLLRGSLGGRLSLQASGADLDAIVDSARGAANLKIARGAITSFSVLKQIAALLEMAGGKGIGKDETPFESLGGSFSIGSRRAQTSDLALDSTDLDITGAGSVGLDTALDLALAARFSEEASRGMVEKTSQLRSLADSEGRLVLHLLAQGNLAQPRIGLDTRAQARQMQRQAKDQVKEKLRGRLLDLLGGQEEEQTPDPPPPE